MKWTIAEYDRFVDKVIRKIRRYAKKGDSDAASLSEDGMVLDFVDYITTLDGPYSELAKLAMKVRSTHKIKFLRDYEKYDVRFNGTMRKGSAT